MKPGRRSQRSGLQGGRGWWCAAGAIVCAALAPLSVAAVPQDLPTAWVSWVIDGDTVTLLTQPGGEPLRWRLAGIDAPESCQPGGVEARDALLTRVHRRTVLYERLGQDSHGRLLGRLWLDGVDVGAGMVRAGWAWAYGRRGAGGPYAAFERQARREGLGLFARPDGGPETAAGSVMAPALFRRFHGPCRPDEAGLATDQVPVWRVPQTGQAGSR